ncbi:MAG: hypothetical protein MUF10_05510 [Thermoanaerobaculaceae bacterium]|jgi:hypothetical protein|nr:hypothetical protein [Thermoanaerobaculaceae bacterium]
MNRTLWIGAAGLLLAAAAVAQQSGQLFGGQKQGFQGWLYEGAHWLNNGGANDALFRASDYLYEGNDALFSVFGQGRRRHQPWWQEQYLHFPGPRYGSEMVVPEPPPGPVERLTIYSEVRLAPGEIAELRLHLNGVQLVLDLAPEIVVDEAPAGGFRYGIQLIVRREGSGEVLQSLSGYGQVTLGPHQQTVFLTRQGDTVILK